MRRPEPRFLALDLPGFGGSPLPPWFVRDYLSNAAHLVLAVAAECAAGPVVLLGHSLGGSVALGALHLAHREGAPPILGAVLLAPALPTRRLPPFVRLRRLGAYRLGEASRRWAPRALHRAGTRVVLEVAASRMLADPRSLDPSWIESGVDALCRPRAWLDLEAIAAELEEVLMGRRPSSAELLASVERIDRPVRVVVGERDPVVPPVRLRDLARRLPRAELTQLAGIGHCPQIECPAATAELIEECLARWGRP